MGVTVYAYEVQPGTSQPTGFGLSLDDIVRELRQVRAEIARDEGSEVSPSFVIAFDMLKPDLDQLFAALNGDASLCDLVLRNKLIVQTVAGKEDDHS
jgi:hypothetical protein